jgi:hypothetical protein
VYDGEWFRGAYHGRGTLSSVTEGTFTGIFCQDQKVSGVFKDRFGLEYEGTFVDQVFDGFGKLSDGITIYEGQFSKGRKHGEGKESLCGQPTAPVIEGEWVDGVRVCKK